MITDQRILNKLNQKTTDCPVSNARIYMSDAKDIEYVRTKRGTDIFVHTKCVPKWGNC